MAIRSPRDYENESLRDGLIILETLLGAPSRGYSVTDFARMCELPYDKCYRALHTLMLQGYARKFLGAWKPGDRCRVFAARTDLAFVRDQNVLLHAFEDELAIGEDVLKVAGSMAEF